MWSRTQSTPIVCVCVCVCCAQLEGLLRENGNVRLVVVDSVAFHFRRDFADMVLRTRLLNGMAQTLLRLAAENELAVRLFNYVYLYSDELLAMGVL